MSNKKTNSNKKYERADVISLYIKKDVSDELLNWFNSQVDVSPAILYILEKYAKGELINADIFKNINTLQFNNKQIQNCQSNVESSHNTSNVKDNSPQPPIIEKSIEEIYDDNIINPICTQEDEEDTQGQAKKIASLEQTPSSDNKEREVDDKSIKGNKKKPILSSPPTFANQNSVKSVFSEDK